MKYTLLMTKPCDMIGRNAISRYWCAGKQYFIEWTREAGQLGLNLVAGDLTLLDKVLHITQKLACGIVS
ncbi:hypothetical protein D3C80_2081340 [compost metagenome]